MGARFLLLGERGGGGAGAPCLSLQFATLLTLERSLPFSLSVFLMF